MDIIYETLLFLLRASSKAQVKTLMRLAAQVPYPRVIKDIQSEMDLTDSEFSSLLTSLTKLEMLYMRGYSLEFPENFHSNLRSLLESVLEELVETISKESPQPGLPKYQGIDWRIDIRTSNSSVEKTPKMPKAVIELKIDEKREVIELSRERVQSLLDMLGKVKEQLDTLADN